MNISVELAVTIASISIALIVFGLGYIERGYSERRRRTLDFILSVIAEDGEIGKANLEFAVWVAENRSFQDTAVHAEERRVIVKLLDYYDLIADTAMKGVLDKEMIVTHLGGRMRSTYLSLHDYVASRRESLERPGLYRPLEQFVKAVIHDRQV